MVSSPSGGASPRDDFLDRVLGPRRGRGQPICRGGSFTPPPTSSWWPGIKRDQPHRQRPAGAPSATPATATAAPGGFGHHLPGASGVLRGAAPCSSSRAWAQEDMALGGKTIRPGPSVHQMLGAANRDPQRFTDPEPPGRDAKGGARDSRSTRAHAPSWGWRCARLEGHVAFETVLQADAGNRVGAGTPEYHGKPQPARPKVPPPYFTQPGASEQPQEKLSTLLSLTETRVRATRNTCGTRAAVSTPVQVSGLARPERYHRAPAGRSRTVIPGGGGRRSRRC